MPLQKYQLLPEESRLHLVLALLVLAVVTIIKSQNTKVKRRKTVKKFRHQSPVEEIVNLSLRRGEREQILWTTKSIEERIKTLKTTVVKNVTPWKALRRIDHANIIQIRKKAKRVLLLLHLLTEERMKREMVRKMLTGVGMKEEKMKSPREEKSLQTKVTDTGMIKERRVLPLLISTKDVRKRRRKQKGMKKG